MALGKVALFHLAYEVDVPETEHRRSEPPEVQRGGGSGTHCPTVPKPADAYPVDGPYVRFISITRLRSSVALGKQCPGSRVAPAFEHPDCRSGIEGHRDEQADGNRGSAVDILAVAQSAADEQKSFADFLEQILSAERKTRQGRTRSTMSHVGFVLLTRRLLGAAQIGLGRLDAADGVEDVGLRILEASQRGCARKHGPIEHTRLIGIHYKTKRLNAM